uniref:NADH-ubiquinone oxidoreductase chain 5 n=1 Tax=Pantoxystus rubricollis TaxID=1738269 RepID=A0A343C1T8_9CUCU|nr:NADH dehydrogenase subunit 5 [Pantoxystus rubricollis]
MFLFYMVNFVILLVISLLLFFLGLNFLVNNLVYYLDLSLLALNSLSLNMVIILDWISLLFMSFVLFISSMIILYSSEYMSEDKNFLRFLFLVLLFVLSMMFMIMSPNLVSVLLGWDGLGLVSYVLVIYYQNTKSYNAGMLTALSNRLGDASLLMSIALMANLGSWNYISFMEIMKLDYSIMLVSVFIVLAAITKSAQIPFSSWLPAAMAAPTPVSSLVHSSTLVTAGVYLLIRFNQGFPLWLMSVLLYLSLFTMFMAGLGANFEFDLKKIIALSTLSQLGMMIVILSLGDSELAFFHLLIHALFKALLFMCAGVIIHNLGNFQDIRYMGGVNMFFPVTSVCLNISNFALCGLPFLSGFYSKDLVAEILSMEYIGLFIYLIFYISIGLTVSYSMRLSYYLLYSNFDLLSLNIISENNNKIMLKGMMGLIMLVILKGSVLSWVLFPSPYFIILPMTMKMLTLIMILMGALVGYEVSLMGYNFQLKSLSFISATLFLGNMWNMPILSTFGMNLYVLNIGKEYLKNFDQGWLEFYGSKGMFTLLMNFSQIFQYLSINHMKVCMLLVFMFIFMFIVYLL